MLGLGLGRDRAGRTGGGCGRGRGRRCGCRGETVLVAWLRRRDDRRWRPWDVDGRHLDASHLGGGRLDSSRRRRHDRRRGRFRPNRVGIGLAAAGLRRRLAGLDRLLGLLIPLQAFAFSLSTSAISLGLLDARGVSLHPDAQRVAEVDRLLVREAELLGELVDPDLSCHARGQPFIGIEPPGSRRATSKCGTPVRTETRSVPRSEAGTAPTGRRSARATARVRIARRAHSAERSAHSHAPRPGAWRSTTT
jgi:hypothetical protein